MTAEMTYSEAGVDTAEGARAVDAIRAAVHSTYRPEVIGDIGGFGGLFSAAAFKDMDAPVLVSGTDGVGTKLALAQRFGRQGTVGIDLVAMCANDILACGAEPLFFLDYLAIGRIEHDHVAHIVSGIAEGCRQARCALIGGEMAEHPGVMEADDYDLSGFCVGVVDRPKMIGPDKVREGDVIVGLASSGIHSNGYSLVRAALTDTMSDTVLMEPRDELGGVSTIDALMAPTRIYVGPILELLRSGADVHALAHITGGGITENLDRALPDTLDAQVELDGWHVPPIIQMVCRAAGLQRAQALRTFNMGVGMAVICAPEDAATVKVQLEQSGEQPFIMGRVVRGTGKVIYI